MTRLQNCKVAATFHLSWQHDQHLMLWSSLVTLVHHRGAIHVGQNISSILSHRIMPASAPAVQLRAAVFGTAAGSIASLAPTWDGLPVEELLTLQKEMIMAVPQIAGLNPASFR